jgi:hypothetical protein
MKLWARSGVALIIGLGIGGTVGAIYSSRTIGLSSRWMSQWAADGQYDQLAVLEYRNADNAHARAALQDFLKFTEQMKANGKVSDPRTFGTDVALAHMRLATLDRQSGDMDGYQSNLVRAQESLRAVGVQHTSAEDLEKFLSQHEKAQEAR